MNTPSSLTIDRLDLLADRHSSAFLTLLDHYAQDPMGGGHPLKPEARNHLVERLRERTDFVGFIAFHGQQPCGLINCFEGFSTFAARPLLNIHDIVVLRELRGQGIARKLLAAAADEARRRNCCKLTLEVLSNNTAALRTYQQAGFAPYQLDPAAGQALFMQCPL
ncbi:GNAT family N-acetyltransferase [Parazoarcus communis]|uniref:GNAT family N-acetyltransferase n=1 Tax=Parazoarcus communis SWub3 = DSM 12120 TaxID=1121029 RepID=A0A323V2V9_9RHOO|nr:GNAT family N-acetyltransferase [Parazoarcus communis]NMG69197.1 GNAT family N-acetyltransferase [Parazoarcus communis SWub3 = DSM 12120]PZA18443.1 GNAT family N-acetyltransferase [Azoarcus communis] [Parazoarcus communis SWub3 = DSM 12120]